MKPRSKKQFVETYFNEQHANEANCGPVVMFDMNKSNSQIESIKFDTFPSVGRGVGVEVRICDTAGNILVLRAGWSKMEEICRALAIHLNSSLPPELKIGESPRAAL